MHCLTFKCCAFSRIYLLNFSFRVGVFCVPFKKSILDQNRKTQNGSSKLLLEIEERVTCLVVIEHLAIIWKLKNTSNRLVNPPNDISSKAVERVPVDLF